MKCPYCEYENGCSGEKLDNDDESEGDFYSLSNDVAMNRGSDAFWGNSTNAKIVYACPHCGKIFIEV
jgi:hypothetical protein